MKDVCESVKTHDELIAHVKENIVKEDTIIDLAELFKIFGDSTRIKILSALFLDELCVCDISKLTFMSISAVSHQLRILRQAKLVRSKKVGKEVFYSLADNHVFEIFRLALEHVNE